MYGGIQMLQINRIKILIRTSNGEYGFCESFKTGLNFIASEDNTCGKSSILAAIYYCLGMEEIIGGKGEKVLTSAYKSFIEDGDEIWAVLESSAYLEVFNGIDTITIFRSAKMENRDSKLVTVFYSALDLISSVETEHEDMYVHMPNAAVNQKGFHAFLEKYIGLELPVVPASDDSERKLYLQLIFSCMFIEQKRGWADIFSGMPILGIKDSKKRVLEFILGLDTIKNERKRSKLLNNEGQIKSKWEKLAQEVSIFGSREWCSVVGIPYTPQVLDENILASMHIFMNDEKRTPIDNWIGNLVQEYNSLKISKPKIIDNFEELQVELQETEKSITFLEKQISNEHSKLISEEACIKSLVDNLDIVKMDLINNKDAARLRNLGSNVGCKTSIGVCPVCNQAIQDTLLPNPNLYEVMSIDENIKHLGAQKDMLEFALEGHKKNKEAIKDIIKNYEEKLFTLRRLAKSIRSDLFSVDEDLSETIIHKRLEIANKIEDLNNFKEYVIGKKKEFAELSEQWAQYLSDRASLPTNKFSKTDEQKLLTLRNNFVLNLENYGYKSVSNLNEVTISKDTYLPVTEGFDMKFDSSASDNIRAIWAFTMSLMQTSTKLGGNHPNILIFDEPDQHSIVISDMEQFFNSIIEFNGTCQVFIGITIKDSDTKNAIEKLNSNSYKIIRIGSKAFTKANSKFIGKKE